MNKLLLTTVMVALLTTGCRKPSAQAPSDRTEGDGNTPSSPIGAPDPNTTPQVPPRPRGNTARSRLNLKVNSTIQLKELGKGYLSESILGPVQGPQQLRNMPLRDAFGKPLGIIYKVDLNRVQNRSQYVLAWEQWPDATGKRYVLMADCTTVHYVTDEQFKRMQAVR